MNDDWLNRKIEEWRTIELLDRKNPHFNIAMEKAFKEMMFAIGFLLGERGRLKEILEKDIQRLQAQNDFEAGCG